MHASHSVNWVTLRRSTHCMLSISKNSELPSYVETTNAVKLVPEIGDTSGDIIILVNNIEITI